MSGQIQTVLYELEVKPKLEAAEAGLTSLGKKAKDVAGNTNIDFKVNADAGSLTAFGGKLDDLKAKATAAGAGVSEGLSKPIPLGAIEQLEKNLHTLEEQKKKAFTVSEAAAFEAEIRKTKAEMDHFNKSVEEAGSKGESSFSKLKSSIHGAGGGEGGGGGIGASLLGGAVGGGVATAAIEGFKFLSEKAHEAHAATEQVTVAIAKAGLTGEAASEEIKRIGESAAKIGDDFALPANEVKQLQGTIVGFSGLTGGALDHLTEISIGASKALGLSAEGVARLIAKSADPESVATLKRLGIQFDANATAAEKMAVIEKKLGPSIQAAKDANNDAAGSFEKVKNNLTETLVSLGSSLFEAIGPAIKAIKDVLDTVKPVLDPVIDALSFLLGIGIKMTLLPLTIAKAFITWAGSLTIVKDGIKAVSSAVESAVHFITGLIDKIKNIGSSILEFVGITKKEDETTRQTNEALKLKAEAENTAAEAAKKNSEATDAAIASMQAETQAATENVKQSRETYLLNKKIAEDPSRSDADRAAAKRYEQDWIDYAKFNQKKIDLDKKNRAEFDKNLAAPEKGTAADLLAIAKKKSDETATQLETSIKLHRLQAGIAFSEQDQLTVDQKRLDVFNQLVEKHDLLASKKYQVGADLQLSQDQIKILEDKTKIDLKANVTIDNSAIEGSLAEYEKWQADLDKRLRDAGIAVQADGLEKEKALLDAKEADELAQFNTGFALTKKELDLKMLIQEKFEQDKLALAKKYAVKASDFEKELTASAEKGITSIVEAAFAKRAHLSDADIASKNLGFQKEQESLQKSLNQGTISYQEYSVGAQKLAQDTANFRNQQENSTVAAVENAAKKAIASTLEVVNAKIALAAASAFAGAVGTDPTPLGIIEGAAASALVLGLLKGVESALGFEKGGLAFTGEKGVEVIGPAKDFSQFATQLVLTTSKQVAQALGNQTAGNGGRQSGRGEHRFSFAPVGIPGRNINLAVQQENLLNKTERIGSAVTA